MSVEQGGAQGPGKSLRLAFSTERVTLVGEPGRCVGLLRARNPHAVSVWPGRAWLRSERAELCDPCHGGPLEILLYGTLCPGEERAMRLSLRLPPRTPPGAYEGFIEGGEGEPTPATIHVLEQRRVQLSPGGFALRAAPGSTLLVRTTVENLGNVTVEIPAHGAVALQPTEHGWPDHFHAAVKAHGNEGYEKFLDAFVKRMGAEEPPVGRAKLIAGAGPLAAQDGRLLEIEISLPKKLRNDFSYAAVVRIADAGLDIALHTTTTDPTTPPG
jgi:hypothetical protein